MMKGGLRAKGISKASKADKPLVSIVTVVYNGSKTLEQTIKSVLNQSYDNVEYIVMDGASSDNTVDIIKKYEDKIDYWQSEPDKGIYDAMNKGIDLASGDYIALLNADDWYEPFACETMVKGMLKSKADVYHAALKYVDDDGKILKVEGNSSALIANEMIAHPTCFVSKEIYKTKKYDTSYKSAADYDFVNGLVKNGASFCFIPEIIANFRIGGMSSNKVGAIETLKIKLRYGHISYMKYLLKTLYIKLRKHK